MITFAMPPTTMPQLFVESDAFRVARESSVLMTEVHAAVAVCVYDDTQGVGGLLHLRYVATSNDQALDLTDNTLSSDLLLMDRFCKELRKVGARKQSWQVDLIGHTPDDMGMTGPAATVLDLVKAYFTDSRRPVRCREIRRQLGLTVRLESREGRIFVNGAAAAVPASAAGSFASA